MDKSKFNDKKEWRKFSISLAIVGIAFVIFQLVTGRGSYLYFFGGSLILLITGMFLPGLIKPLFILFSYFGFITGWLMTRVILIVLFYLIITPMGLLAKLFGTSFLDMKFKEKKESYWVAVKEERSARFNYERQF